MKTNNMFICEGHELSSTALENGRLELCVAVTGEWKSRKMKVTDKELQQMADNFNAEAKPLLFDYDHRSLGSLFSDADSRAAGWGHSLRIENGKILVEMEPTPKGRELIEAGEYKYLSPVYEYQRLDRVSGKKLKDWRLHSVALTNTPFLTELPAIKNHESNGGFVMDELIKLLGATDEDDALNKIKNMMAANAADKTALASLEAAKTTLEADKAALQATINAQEVDAAIAAQKITPAQKPLALKLINSDRALYDEFLASSAKPPLTSEVPIPQGDGNPLDPFVKVQSFSDLLSDPELGKKLKAENPSRYKDLHERWMKEKR